MHRKTGFAVIELIIALAVIGAIAGIVVYATSGPKKNNASQQSSGSNDTQGNGQGSVRWEWNGDKWQASSTPPSCKEPIAFSVAPTDLSKVTAVLYPGQSRGNNYKPHGGLRFDKASSNNLSVKAIMDGRVASGARYIEMGEVQYMFTIVNDCGIAYRYDHLLTLSPAFQKIADSLPSAKENDSRTTDFTADTLVKAGDEVATAVGFAKSGNVSFDLGVYDYRQRNQAAQDADYVATHKNFLSQAGHALCWLDMFSSADNAVLKSLPAGDQASGKSSDYCR
ncbi:prepilin-type N-terminal cleavage/methylation domain-containing protein [bacterium]|nr:prepilin-type N-terminal cleavage/methylation domain-containing protein [bacterium]